MSNTSVATETRPRGGTPAPGGPAPLAARHGSADRRVAALSHFGPPIAVLLGALIWPAGLLVLGIPLIIRFTAGTGSAFVQAHASEVLNFVLSWLFGVGFATAFLLPAGFHAPFVLLVAALGFGLLMAILLLRGGWAALQGKSYRYPLTMRLAH